jgi:HEAT repeat protein
MAAKRNFDQQLAALDALRQQPEQVRERGLRKALTHRNNFLVAKAADLVREFQMAQLIPELPVSFDRFFHNPGKTDPQCWAKNALSRSLATLEHQDAGVFLRGMRHIQMEPIWGGRSDTAGTLRATCALALVQGSALSESALLAHLLELLGDTDKGVRREVVRAIEQVGSSSAVLLLRLRAVLGADEPEVLGACYSGILCIEGLSAIPWVGRFLASGDECAAEAALAIAGTHSPEGFAALRECLAKANDPWWHSVLLSAIALTRQEEAVDFLLDFIRSESPDAEAAITALLRAVPSSEVVNRLRESVAGNSRLTRVFAQHNAPSR